jgi:hypothetical protein
MFRTTPSTRCLQLAVIAIALLGASPSRVEGSTLTHRVPISVTSVRVNIRPLRGRDWLKPDPIFAVTDRGLVRRIAIELDSYALRRIPPSGARFPTKCGKLVYIVVFHSHRSPPMPFSFFCGVAVWVGNGAVNRWRYYQMPLVYNLARVTQHLTYSRRLCRQFWEGHRLPICRIGL